MLFIASDLVGAPDGIFPNQASRRLDCLCLWAGEKPGFFFFFSEEKSWSAGSTSTLPPVSKVMLSDKRVLSVEHLALESCNLSAGLKSADLIQALIPALALEISL